MADETPKEQDEMLEFLKRGEVRTMAKDIAVLRKEEAQRERERIEKIGQPTATPLMPALSTNEPKTTTVSLPQKPAMHTKIFVRVLVFLVVLGALSLAGWAAYPKFKAKPHSNPAPAPAPKPAPALQIPPPVFAMQNTKTLEITKKEDILPSLANFLKSNSLQGFTRIVFALNGSVAGPQEFFASTKMVFPENLAQKMEDNFTLFAYSGNAQNRVGFITTFALTDGVYDTLRAGEPAMETNFSSFASIIGQKDKAYIKFFRSITYKKVLIRCQTFSLQDLGLCYTLVDNHFVLASSLESMKAAIDQLKTI